MEPWWPTELARHGTEARSSNRKEHSRGGIEAEEEPGTNIQPEILAESRPKSAHLTHITGPLAWIEVVGL